MPDTRFTLIGKVCVWAVRATDTELKKVLKAGGWKGLPIRKFKKLSKSKMRKIGLKPRRKKASRKQLAWRKEFARRAKAGMYR